MFRIPEKIYAWLIAAKVHYGLFGKLIKGFPHLEDFEVSVIDGLSSAKIVKTSTLSSPANDSSGRFFGFVKCPFYLKITQVSTFGYVKRPFPLMEIEKSPQLSVDRIICLIFFVVGSTGNGNSEQF